MVALCAVALSLWVAGNYLLTRCEAPWRASCMPRVADADCRIAWLGAYEGDSPDDALYRGQFMTAREHRDYAWFRASMIKLGVYNVFPRQ